jgi:flagellum-specific peptidoglycan hydrolase FlgJ
MTTRFSTRPWWQQATALVTVSTGGVVTGLTFAHGTAAAMTTPEGLPPVHLMALEQAASPDAGTAGASSDTQLRSAVVNVAKYYLQLSKTRTPAQMEALIWGKDSTDGADHGPSCAAFASLALELGAQAAGQQSWITGGGTYPWPVHSWADARVQQNPDSPAITSLQQNAQDAGRWHAAGDGYQPSPGDFAVFDQHVEVITSYSGGVLDTIGADSLPGYTVNAHTYSGTPAASGIEGYIDNGSLQTAATPARTGATQDPSAQRGAKKGTSAANKTAAAGQAASSAKKTPAAKRSTTAGESSSGQKSAGAGRAAAIPGSFAQQPVTDGPSAGSGRKAASAAATPAVIPGLAAAGSTPDHGSPSGTSTRTSPAIPGLVTSTPVAATAGPGSSGPRSGAAKTSSGTSGAGSGQYTQYTPAPGTSPATQAQQAFLSSVIPGAIAAQQRYGVPAAVTIAQAIDESNWGTSELAAAQHNLFGIKGTGPAGTAGYPTREYEAGQWITVNAYFASYRNIAESISDHAQLLATSGYYTRAMADRNVPDAFANDLTGVYATNPDYGANLISLMKLYDLYRYDTPGSGSGSSSAPSGQAASHTAPYATPRKAASPHKATGTKSASQEGAVRQPAASTSAPLKKPAPRPTPKTPSRQSTAVPKTAVSPAAGRGTAAGQSATVKSQRASRRSTGTQNTGTPTTGTRSNRARGTANIPGVVTASLVSATSAPRYQAPLPATVTAAYFTTAKSPLGRGEQLYRDVASRAGISWKLLAACDWMQCQASSRHSPVHGEKLGTVNGDGSVYGTRSEALAQCAADMVELAGAVYGIDLTVPRPMSIRSLAEVFAAFRWGGLLDKHGVSAMEFPYSVAGLTEDHTRMQWPAISERVVPDKPGSKFRQPFGAVPVLLSLKYPATV